MYGTMDTHTILTTFKHCTLNSFWSLFLIFFHLYTFSHIQLIDSSSFTFKPYFLHMIYTKGRKTLAHLDSLFLLTSTSDFLISCQVTLFISSYTFCHTLSQLCITLSPPCDPAHSLQNLGTQNLDILLTALILSTLSSFTVNLCTPYREGTHLNTLNSSNQNYASSFTLVPTALKLSYSCNSDCFPCFPPRGRKNHTPQLCTYSLSNIAYLLRPSMNPHHIHIHTSPGQPISSSPKLTFSYILAPYIHLI